MKARDIEIFNSIGSNIKKIRLSKGFSQQDVANRCDVDRAKISSIENAKEDFVFTTLLEIARALDVKVTEFMTSFEK